MRALDGSGNTSRDAGAPEHTETEGAKPVTTLVNTHAQALWDYLIPRLEAQRVLTEPDLIMLAHLCNYHGKIEQVWEMGEKPKAADMTQLRMLFLEFGLTPASRSGVGGGQSDPDDEFFSGPKLDQ